MTTIKMSTDEFESFDFNRECLQADINRGHNPDDWDYEDKLFIHTELNARELYVYDKNNNIIDFTEYFKLLDFVNSKT